MESLLGSKTVITFTIYISGYEAFQSLFPGETSTETEATSLYWHIGALDDYLNFHSLSMI